MRTANLLWLGALAACQAVAPLDALREPEADGASDAAVDAVADLASPDVAPPPADAAAPSSDAAPPPPDAAPADAAPADAAVPPVDTALPDGQTPDAQAADAQGPDAQGPDAAPPECVVDADCAPELCRNGRCVDRVQFDAPRDTPVGTGPVGVVSLAADADGNVDLAVINQDSGDLTVLLGAGDGTFVALAPVQVGARPTGLTVGLVNDDPNEDLVVANTDDGTILLLLSDGTGGFAHAQSLPTGANAAALPNSVALGDFNGDLLQDAAVANGDGTVGVLLGELDGNGDPGVFGDVVTFPATGAPTGLAVATFEGDANLDLLLAEPNEGKTVIMEGDGLGTFSANVELPVLQGGQPLRVAVADFDEDTVTDRIAVVFDQNYVQILFAGGAGAIIGAGATPSGAVGADIDGDGHPDLVMSHIGDASVGVNCGDGARGFEATLRVFPAGAEAADVLVVDVNGDGRPDVVTPNHGADSVSVLLNTSPGPAN